MRSQEEPGGARRTQEEPGRASGSQEEPKDTGVPRSAQGEPGGARICLLPCVLFILGGS